MNRLSCVAISLAVTCVVVAHSPSVAAAQATPPNSAIDPDAMKFNFRDAAGLLKNRTILFMAHRWAEDSVHERHRHARAQPGPIAGQCGQ